LAVGFGYQSGVVRKVAPSYNNTRAVSNTVVTSLKSTWGLSWCFFTVDRNKRKHYDGFQTGSEHRRYQCRVFVVEEGVEVCIVALTTLRRKVSISSVCGVITQKSRHVTYFAEALLFAVTASPTGFDIALKPVLIYTTAFPLTAALTFIQRQ